MRYRIKWGKETCSWGGNLWFPLLCFDCCITFPREVQVHVCSSAVVRVLNGLLNMYWKQLLMDIGRIGWAILVCLLWHVDLLGDIDVEIQKSKSVVKLVESTIFRRRHTVYESSSRRKKCSPNEKLEEGTFIKTWRFGTWEIIFIKGVFCWKWRSLQSNGGTPGASTARCLQEIVQLEFYLESLIKNFNWATCCKSIAAMPISLTNVCNGLEVNIYSISENISFQNNKYLKNVFFKWSKGRWAVLLSKKTSYSHLTRPRSKEYETAVL